METFLHRCLQLASLGGTDVFPNPKVGSVITHDGQIIGEGYHTAVGKAHAEIEAFNNIPRDLLHLLSESTLYVNLEPCSHYGRTPPCVDEIIKRSVPHVVIGCKDPNPKVAGRGIQKLQSRGVKVDLVPNPFPFQHFNRVFFTNQLLNRSYVCLKWAESSNRKIAGFNPKSGKHLPVRITGFDSNLQVHKLRSLHHSILVGRRTAAIDNPRLTNRLYPGSSPIRIVLDPQKRLPKYLTMFSDGLPTMVITSREIQSSDATVHEWTNLSSTTIPYINVEHIYLEKANLSNLFELCSVLYTDYQISSILIEGGTNVLQQFINQSIFDEIHVFTGSRKINHGLNAPVLPENFTFDSINPLGVDIWKKKYINNWLSAY